LVCVIYKVERIKIVCKYVGGFGIVLCKD